jgi:ClpP class serine protease
MEYMKAGVPLSALQLHNRKIAAAPYLINSDGTTFKATTASSTLNSTSSKPNSERNRIAVLNLFGTMRTEGTWCNYGIRDLADWIDYANSNSGIGGILIIANSGGGEVAAGAMLKNALMDSKIPCVVHAEMLASAAIHGTLPANDIVAASDNARIGSIGTLVSVSKKILDYYKDNMKEIYAEQSTAKNAEFRALLNGDESLIIKDLNQTASIFQNDVKKRRPNVGDNQEAMSGKLFFAQEARKIGLVDAIGTRKKAESLLRWHMKHA